MVMNLILNYAKAMASSVWFHLVGGRGEYSDLKTKTAMVIVDALPPEVCRELVEKIDSIVDDPDHPRVWRDNLASDSRVLGLEHEIGDLTKYFEVERHIEAVDSYMGRKTRSWFLMANRVVTKDNNLGSGGGMHRDSPFSHQVKCIWYLSDVAEENGPFQYVPGTNVNLIKMRHLYPLGQSRFEKLQNKPIEVHARAGSLLVCDTKCIHGGKPIQKDIRYAVTLYTLPKTEGASNVFRKSGLDPRLAVESI